MIQSEATKKGLHPAHAQVQSLLRCSPAGDYLTFQIVIRLAGRKSIALSKSSTACLPS